MYKKITLFFALMLSSASFAANENILKTIADRLSGTFDNSIQTLLEKNSENPHQRLHFEHISFPSLFEGGVNIYVEQSVAASGYVYRQRVYNITLKNGQPTLEIYSFKSPKDYLGSHLDPSKLSNLKAKDLTYVDGCDVTFGEMDSENVISGYTNPESCIINSRGKTLHVTTELIIYKTSFKVYDEAFDSDGNAVWYREDKTGHIMNKARVFDCWSVLRKGDTKESGWEVSKNNRVHDQGGKFTIEFGDNKFDITLSQLFYGQEKKPILKLGFHKKDVSPTFTYTWANHDATNIGLNSGYLQAGCTLVK